MAASLALQVLPPSLSATPKMVRRLESDSLQVLERPSSAIAELWLVLLPVDREPTSPSLRLAMLTSRTKLREIDGPRLEVSP